MTSLPMAAFDEDQADARLAIDRQDVDALFAKAEHRSAAGDHRAAAAFYSACAANCRNRVGGPSAAALAAHAESRLEQLAAVFRGHLERELAKAPIDRAHWPERFRLGLSILLGERQREPEIRRYPTQPKLFYYPGLPQVEFVDPAMFRWREAVERAFPAIRRESLDLLGAGEAFAPYVVADGSRPVGDTHGMLGNRDWSSAYLWARGERQDGMASTCPAAFAALEDVPLFDVAARSPTALFSLLRAKAHIPPHTGMLNCRYICHLPLIVPPGCAFRVGSRTVEWREGEMLVFDDSVEHEAWNRSDQDRVILLFEVWSPDLSESEILLIRTLLEAVDTYR